MKKFVIPMALCLIFFWTSVAGAVLIDPYDNYLPPDGFYGLLYGNYYHAYELTDSSGKKAAGINLTAKVAVARGLYYHHIGKVPLAFQLIVPMGQVQETKLFQERSSGVGDITFGPAIFLYANQKQNTYLSYWFYITAPTGQWDKNQTINLGAHHWYFEHQLAFEQLWKGVVYDMNLNYYQHLKEPDTDYTAPDRFELEASLAYQLTDKFVVGVNGGGYWDQGNGKVNGADVPATKAKRIQFGPSMGYNITQNLGVNLRWTHDLASSNDTKGDDVWMRVSYAF